MRKAKVFNPFIKIEALLSTVSAIEEYKFEFINQCTVSAAIWCAGVRCNKGQFRFVISFQCNRKTCQHEVACLTFRDVVSTPWRYKYLSRERARTYLSRRLNKLAGKKI